MTRFRVVMPSAVWLLLPVLVIAGCFSGRSASVSGHVMLDDAPLDDADITFIPLGNEELSKSWTKVLGGRYTISPESGLRAGKFRVEIRALRKADTINPGSDPAFLVPTREIVPEKFNHKSILTVELDPGPNAKDFQLQSD